MGIRQDGVTFLGDNGPNAIKANGGSNYIFGQGGNDTTDCTPIS